MLGGNSNKLQAFIEETVQKYSERDYEALRGKLPTLLDYMVKHSDNEGLMKLAIHLLTLLDATATGTGVIIAQVLLKILIAAKPSFVENCEDLLHSLISLQNTHESNALKLDSFYRSIARLWRELLIMQDGSFPLSVNSFFHTLDFDIDDKDSIDSKSMAIDYIFKLGSFFKVILISKKWHFTRNWLQPIFLVLCVDSILFLGANERSESLIKMMDIACVDLGYPLVLSSHLINLFQSWMNRDLNVLYQMTGSLLKLSNIPSFMHSMLLQLLSQASDMGMVLNLGCNIPVSVDMISYVFSEESSDLQILNFAKILMGQNFNRYMVLVTSGWKRFLSANPEKALKIFVSISKAANSARFEWTQDDRIIFIKHFQEFASKSSIDADLLMKSVYEMSKFDNNPKEIISAIEDIVLKCECPQMSISVLVSSGLFESAKGLLFTTQNWDDQLNNILDIVSSGKVTSSELKTIISILSQWKYDLKQSLLILNKCLSLLVSESEADSFAEDLMKSLEHAPGIDFGDPSLAGMLNLILGYICNGSSSPIMTFSSIYGRIMKLALINLNSENFEHIRNCLKYFLDCRGQAISDQFANGLAENEESLVKIFKQTLESKTNNFACQYHSILLIRSILENFTEIQGGFYVLLLFMLVDDSILGGGLLRHEAHKNVKELAKLKSVSVSNLFYSLGRDFYIFVANLLISRRSGLQSISELTNISLKELITSSFPYSMPKLLETQNFPCMEFVSKTVGLSISKILLEYGYHVIIYVLLYKSEADLQEFLERCLQMITENDEKKSYQYVTRMDLIRCSYNTTCLELLIEMGRSASKRKALHGLCVIASIDQNCSVQDANLKIFLKPNLPFLVYRLSDLINDRKRDIAFKTMALRSLREVIEIVEEGIALVLPRVISVLSSSSHNEKLVGEIPSIWAVFLKHLPSSHLNSNLTHIAALFADTTMDDNVDDLTKESFVEIFNEFAQNRLNEFIHELRNLPFLSLIPGFGNLKRHCRPNSLKINDEIVIIAKLLTHNSATVVKMGLVYLLSTLNSNRDAIQTLFIPGTIDQGSRACFAALLNIGKRFGPGHDDLDELIISCIGAIGAIDPDYLEDMQMITFRSREKLKFMHDKESMKKLCCFFLRSFLVPVFRSVKDPRTQDRYAYSIQEILKICEFHPDLPLAPSHSQMKVNVVKSEVMELWLEFDQDMRTSIYPLLKTKYQMSKPSFESLQVPLISNVSRFNEWVTKFSAKQTMSIKNHDSSSFFQVLCGLVYSDANAASFFLPYILLHVIVTRSSSVKEVEKEIQAVLTKSLDSSQELEHLSSQAIFSVINELQVFVRSLEEDIIKLSPPTKKKDPALMEKINSVVVEMTQRIDAVNNFIDSIDKGFLAESSFKQKSFTRAIMYYEMYMRGLKEKSDPTHFGSTFQSVCERYQFMYSFLSSNEQDGMHGIVSYYGLSSLHSERLLHENTANWTLAQSCYEVSLESDPSSIKYHKGLLRCMNNCGQLERTLNHIDGLLSKHPEWNEEISDLAAEASWRLSKWDVFMDSTDTITSPSFNLNLGRALGQFCKKDLESFEINMKSVSSSLIPEFLVNGSESYAMNYEKVLQAHILVDLKLAVACYENIVKGSGSDKLICQELNNLCDLWKRRKSVVSSDFKMRDLVLNLHRVCLIQFQSILEGPCKKVAALKLEENLIESCKNARKNGYSLSAYNALLQSSGSLLLGDVERAKWLWHFGDSYEAVLHLKRSLTRWKNMDGGAEKSKFDFANSELLLTRWVDDSNASYISDIIMLYRRAVENYDQGWDKGHFYLARFYNKIFDKDLKGRGNLVREGEYKRKIISSYAKSLYHGTKYIFQALPKLLTLWLDFGDDCVEGLPAIKDAESRKSIEKNLFNIHHILKSTIKQVPAFTFLTAFPQLVSRICVNSNEVFDVLEMIIIHVLINYPERATWHMMSMWKSTSMDRSKRARRIFEKVPLQKSKNEYPAKSIDHAVKIIEESTTLTDNLLRLCDHPVAEKQTSLLLNKELPSLNRICPLRVIIPIQTSMNVALPSTKDLATGYKPFADFAPTFKTFENVVELMPSLQKPKKITVLASDGKPYIFLCKPKDDLRKDSRLMEFNSVINRLFKQDHDTRKRHLYIRTYAVVPLNEECGMIEWVINTVGYRNILNKLYRIRKISNSGSFAQQMLAKKEPAEKKDYFINVLLKHFKSVFYEYFLFNFPDPSAWFSSRLAYTRTSAVISMVGYVIGLGDRHSENILFDNTNGDTVHVDFNCLFEKGLCFSVPERVPFRLTHNMVDAFGVTGYEGVFRKCAEVVMKLLRDHQETLMNVLETFIHDPLVEWSVKPSSRRGGGIHRNGPEVNNEEAMRHLQSIEKKLTGRVQTANLPLSVAGQVQQLIAQATSSDNLSQMYVGWAPYL